MQSCWSLPIILPPSKIVDVTAFKFGSKIVDLLVFWCIVLFFQYTYPQYNTCERCISCWSLSSSHMDILVFKYNLGPCAYLQNILYFRIRGSSLYKHGDFETTSHSMQANYHFLDVSCHFTQQYTKICSTQGTIREKLERSRQGTARN